MPQRVPDELLARVRDSLGLSPSDHVIAGVRRAMARAGVADPAVYWQHLDRDRSAFADLVTELTVGETYFLREPGQLDFVRREVLPLLARDASSTRTLNAWSAACASGEEAYSLAITARDATPPVPLRVLGTDIAESRLAIARRAVYGDWSLRGVPEATIDRHFERNGRQVKVAPAIRSAVTFRSLNLATDDWTASGIAPGSMDLVFCRNVLIYLDAAAIATIATRLFASLSEQGWLFLGASDPALADLVPCEVIVTGAGLAYRHARPGSRASHRFLTPSALAPPAAAPAFPALEPPSLPPLPPRVVAAAPPTREPAAPAVDPSADALLARARAEYDRNDYLRAAESAREYVTRDGHDAEGWILFVRALANLGRNDEAGLACAAGLDLHRTSAELTYVHAMLLRQAGRNAEALAALRCALFLDRDFVVAHLAVGDVLTAMGDRPAARRAFRNAERLLLAIAGGEPVPGADGLDASRLLSVAQMHLALSEPRDRA